MARTARSIGVGKRAVTTVARGLREHLEAGADHICIQVLGDDLPAGYQELAEALR